MIMLVAAAAIPFRPDRHARPRVPDGDAVRRASLLTLEVYNIGRGVDPIYVLFIFMVTCLSTALTAVVYEQRRSTYEWHKRTLETAEKLRNAEARNLLSENAASVGRLGGGRQPRTELAYRRLG